MHQNQFPYRQLVEELWVCEGRAHSEALVPWLARYPSERDWLERFAERPGAPVPPATVEDLWRLYALCRVVETLLLRFQPGPSAHDSWEGPILDQDELRDFVEALGLRADEAPDYSPFDHEVVEVDHVGGQGRLEVVTHLWPRLTLGPLMIARAAFGFGRASTS